MLKGISPLISPDLLKMLHEMGHGDEVVLADAHFPGHSLGQRVARADGLTIAPLLEAILPLFALDSLENPLTMMKPERSGELDPGVEMDYMGMIRLHVANAAAPQRIPRAEFYQRARSSFLVVMTGETRAFGNILLKKGVTL